MGPPAVNLVLVVLLGLTATLLEPTMVHAEGRSVTPSVIREDSQFSTLQRRQDLLDSRMNDRDTRLNGLDTRLSSRLNGLDTRLSAQFNVVNTRLNRMDSRFDGMETAISDMKKYLQERMEAIDKKVEWALTDIKPRQELNTAQQDIKEKEIVLKYTVDDTGAAYADGMLLDDTVRWRTIVTRNISALTRLLTFKVLNDGGETGVIASVSTGVRTDTSDSWKCSQVYEQGWNQVGFDDSHWGGVDDRDCRNGCSVGIDNGAIRIGCRSKGSGPFFFRRMLN